MPSVGQMKRRLKVAEGDDLPPPAELRKFLLELLAKVGDLEKENAELKQQVSALWGRVNSIRP